MPILLVETDVNTGIFKGTLQLSNGTTTRVNNTDIASLLKVLNGDTVAIFYNDSPSATAEDNMSSYTSTSVYTTGGLGSLVTSKSAAYLSGDNVVVTVIDNDLDTTSSADSNGNAWVNVISSSDATSRYVLMTETGAQTGTFKGTFITGATGAGTTPGVVPTIRAAANGTITVTYADSSPVADITTTVTTKNFGAELAFGADSVAIDGKATVSLYDPETNTAIGTPNLVNVNVKSTTDSTGTTLRLTETGNDTGSFLGTMEVTTSSTLANTRIKAAVGDTLTATFTDSPNASGGVSTVTDTATVAAAVTPTPVTSPTPGASPTATPVTSPTATPVASPTLPPFPSPGASPTLPPFPSPGASPTLPPFPSPIVSPTPTVCEAEKVTVSKTTLSLKRKKSGDVTVTVTGADDCAVEGETVTATINAAGKKRISVSPTSATTDASGAATFTITAKKKTGNARVTFNAGSVKKSITVKVKK